VTQIPPFQMPPLPAGGGIAAPTAATPAEAGLKRQAPKAPAFAEPQPLKLSAEKRKEIANTIAELYQKQVEARESWNKRHQDYDLMFRGALDLRGGEGGPWPGSSNLHVQMPYWLVDSYSTRLVSGIWSQTPQVMGHPTEDDDQEIARNAANLVKWHLQPKRMNARAAWSRMSKTRCIHGRSVGSLPWAKDKYTYRVESEVRFERDSEGSIVTDSEGIPIPATDRAKEKIEEGTIYDGPLLVPHEWDDVIEPMDGINLQPVTQANPLGADWVGIRQWESLAMIWKKKEKTYTYIDDSVTEDKLKDKEDWLAAAPSQDRSGSGQTGSSNQSRARLQDYVEGRTRNEATSIRSPRARPNPEFEILTWYMPWEVENDQGEMEEEECVFFFRSQPKTLIGAFRLSDLQWRNRRPLVELNFQTVGNRRLSMGIMEIVADLSAELDTIHNMRMDVGFATNMPFFFFRATSSINPERITLRPGKGIPVDDVRDVQFPQMQNVTSFYYQEEQLLYSLVERVLGVTDLFLGVSPTRGAAARHATGFVGTQQEAMARTEEVMSADATAFSFLCHGIYEAEVQFGPDHRILRLEGREGQLTQRLSRDELWFRGEYDLTLGANHGLYSSMMRQQQAQILQQQSQISPLINQDPGRRWEAENFIFHAYGFPDPQLFIGPKEAVSQGSPKMAEEENGEMDQGVYGPGVPAPVNPSDNDQDHLQKHTGHLASEAYISMGRPNLSAHLAHIQATQAQMMQKQQMQQMQMQMAAMGGGPGMSGQPGQQQPNARNVAALQGVEQSGAGGDVNASPAVPSFGGGPAAGGNGRA
jgi:hypothetical protein